MALEFEIQRWKGFKKALHDKEDQETFEELMDMCRKQRHGKQQRLQPHNLRTHDPVHSPGSAEKTTAVAVQAERSNLAKNLRPIPAKLREGNY
jgi:hypothetical protein